MITRPCSHGRVISFSHLPHEHLMTAIELYGTQVAPASAS